MKILLVVKVTISEQHFNLLQLKMTLVRVKSSVLPYQFNLKDLKFNVEIINS